MNKCNIEIKMNLTKPNYIHILLL